MSLTLRPLRVGINGFNRTHTHIHTPRSTVSPGTESVPGPFGRGRPNNSRPTRSFQTEPFCFAYELFDDLFGAIKVDRMIYVGRSVHRNVYRPTRRSSRATIRVGNVVVGLERRKNWPPDRVQLKRHGLITDVDGDDGCCFAITTARRKISKSRAANIVNTKINLYGQRFLGYTFNIFGFIFNIVKTIRFL